MSHINESHVSYKAYHYIMRCMSHIMHLYIISKPQLIQWRWSLSTEAQWAACSPHLLLSDFWKPAPYFTLSLSDSSKPAPYFTVLSVKCNWSRIQSKNLVHIRIQSKKSCLRRNFSIKNLETVYLRNSVPLSIIGTRTGASLSSIRKQHKER